MIGVLVAAHVVAALLTIGPITVASSLFPRVTRALIADPLDPRAGAAAVLLNRICRIYAVVSIAVPVLGTSVAVLSGKFGQAWLSTSVALTLAAALVLVLGILPAQKYVLAQAGLQHPSDLASYPTRAAILSGVFNLLWVAVAVLMVLQPGAPRHGA